MEKFLTVTGFGNVHEGHFERGYVLAMDYFQERNLDFVECYKAYQKDNHSELGKHWVDAGKIANLVLYASNQQDFSTLELELELEMVDEDVYG